MRNGVRQTVMTAFEGLTAALTGNRQVRGLMEQAEQLRADLARAIKERDEAKKSIEADLARAAAERDRAITERDEAKKYLEGRWLERVSKILADGGFPAPRELDAPSQAEAAIAFIGLFEQLAYSIGWDGGTTPNAHGFLKREIVQLEGRAMSAEGQEEAIKEALRKIITHLENEVKDRGSSSSMLEAKRIAEYFLSTPEESKEVPRPS